MSSPVPIRCSLTAAFILLFAAAPSFARGPRPFAILQNRAAQRAEARQQAQENRAPGPQQRGQPHLERWMDNHKNLSPAEQHRALQNEPGFRELDPATQQRWLNELDRLNTISPQQRERTVTGVEGLERMSPQQQQQWDSAVQRLHSLPVPRRRMIMRAIANLHEMPPDQRQQTIDSPAFTAQFSPDERETIRTVITAY